MSKVDTTQLNLEGLGITDAQEVYYNLSYEELFEHETSPDKGADEKAIVSESGAVAIDTGKFTGRSPKDKYIIEDDISRDTVWWADGTPSGSDNKKMSLDTWAHLKELSINRLSGKKLYVMDGFCGTNDDTKMRVRIITEIAWMAHFFKNMFIRPTDEELKDFTPDWTILNACKTTCEDYKEHNMNSECFGAFCISEKMTCIGGTWYGGENKKGIFSIMNYFLPLKGIGSYHCSANMGEDGDTALFFGLSGTGKTTLSTDPKRALIGDDEHGWDKEGIFNFEGGCYAKTIGLTREREPGIYDAIRRDALLENVDISEDGKVDYESAKKTQNTRVSYPMHHIDNIVKPVSKGGHPKNIIFLTCDAYGVLPPIAKLTNDQAMYHYLSGYTAKVAGTERGVKEPQATFSACFGQAFLLLHPTQYADILGEQIKEHGSNAYLMNTGWVGGKYGVGERISIAANRAAIDAIFDGSLEAATYETMPIFNLEIPTEIAGIETSLLNPRNSWEDKDAYDETAKNLAEMFIKNFENYTDTEKGKALVSGGPSL